MQLVFATHNQNKFEEVRKILPSHIQLRSLTDIGCATEIPETGKTLEENAKLKADYVTKKYALPCFSDDSGLLVDALNGAPGVYSARYAGPQKNANDNMNLLLTELKGVANRAARFKTIIVLNLGATSHMFMGTVEGTITTEKSGSEGFGYDPIFKPKGYDQTFAALPLEVKNTIGHRGQAIKELLAFLKTFQNEQR